MNSKAPVQFRRHRGGDGWCISDAHHNNFIGGFRTAVVLDVKFTHQAPSMVCVNGYESTGEASGVIEVCNKPVAMPPEVAVTHEVVYDRDRRCFHVVDQPDNIVDAADFLVLQDDGSAQAGWKINSECFPNWIEKPVTVAA